MDYKTHHGNEFDKTPISGSNFYVEYTEPGTSASPRMKGGFVVGYPDTQESALKAPYLSDQNYMSDNWNSLILEFMFVNPNTRTVVLNFVIFQRNSAGVIESKYEAFTSKR